jgi:prevent-host-death family protein
MLITATDIKNKGISFVEKLIEKYGKVFISVRGKRKFVILPIDEYEKLKEVELEMVIKQAEEDYKNGRYIKESAEEHFKRLKI